MHMTFKSFFHVISYLQYPLMMIAMYFAFKPYFLDADLIKEDPNLIFQSLNSVLIFMGLAVSFSSLQDTTKTQNDLSKKIWQDPVKGKITIVIMCCMILSILVYGLIGFFISEDGVIKDLASGAIILALGMFGLLKAAVEMFENHRSDRNRTGD